MKKIIICLALLFALASPIFAFPNSPDGFRGIKWGDSPATLVNGELETKDDSYLRIYTKHDDKMSLGEVSLDGIFYVFCEERLMGVSLKTNSTNFIDMKNILEVQYGQPSQPNRFIEKYIWLDNNAFIVFENHSPRKYCDLRISSLSEVKLMDTVKKERAKKAAGDF